MRARQDPLRLNMRGGARVCVPADLNQAATYVLLEQEDWFENEIRFLRHWLRPGMHAVDVGANYGVYTAAMGRAVGSTGRVWSFEPAPPAVELLRETLASNGFSNVELSPAAVSDRVGTVAFGIGLDSELNRVAAPGWTGEVVSAPSVTIDRVASTRDWSRVEFIKIDVEQHEPEVIAGGAAFFSEHSPLIMLEVLSEGRFQKRALQQLNEMGYEPFRLIPGLQLLAPLAKGELDSFHLNVFACKRPQAEKLAAEGHVALTDAATSSKPDNERWASFLDSAPYASGFKEHWPDKPGLFSHGGARAYYDGLASFAHSRATNQSSGERLAWLRRAFSKVCEAIEDHDSVARLISYARLAGELGLREAQTQALRQAVGRVGSESGKTRKEPFLAPCVRYEQLASDAAQAWLQCALLEELETARAFSSLYGGAGTLAGLGPVFSQPFLSPESERRRQLVQMRGGRQARPEPHPLLCSASEENLNPAYWCHAKAM